MFSLRSTSIKLAFLACAASACAQINPANQINWPSGCNSSTPIYDIYTGLCVANNGGGGSTPYVTPEASGAVGNGKVFFDGTISSVNTLGSSNGNNSTPSSPGMTTQLNNDRVLYIYETSKSWSSAPSAGTNRVNVTYVSSSYGMTMNDLSVATAGSVSAATGTTSASGYWITSSIALSSINGSTSPSFVAAAHTQQTSGATITVSKPTGTANGNYMVGCVAIYLGVSGTYEIGRAHV